LYHCGDSQAREKKGILMTILFPVLLAIALLCAVQMSRWDLRERIIPDVYLFPFLLTGLVVAAYFPWLVGSGESIIAGVFGYGLGLLMSLMFKIIKMDKWTNGQMDRKNTNNKHQLSIVHRPSDCEAIGLGDIKLLAAGGIWLGMTGLPVALIAACVFGGVWGLQKKQKFIPFAPFFFCGMVIAVAFLLVF
jgi:prepilin signal peptidase PulO-like enzyme (type II secretory pathway)